MTDTLTLSVLVPVYNEQFLVEESLNRLLVLGESPLLSRVQVVVVDDCSKDGTPEILERLSRELPEKSDKISWQFLSHEKNRGKGGAVRTALSRAEGDVTIIHDADLEYHPKDILRMIPLFLNEDADAVYGSRFLVHGHRRVLMYRHELGNRLLTFLCNLVSDLNLTDMETCYKAVRTDLLKSIPLRSNDFRIEPELTIKLSKRGARIFETPISYSGRTYQEGKKINWKDGFKAIWAILAFGLSDDYFTEDQLGSQILLRLARAERFNTWMAETIRPYVGQKVLEIGSGIGNLTKKLIPRKSYWATDINPLYLQLSSRLMANKPYMNVGFLDINEVSDFAAQKVPLDTVICLNVLEHIEDDAKALANVESLLSPGGRAIVLVPRDPALYGSLDRVLGHRRRYNEEMLSRLAAGAGLSVEKLIEFNRVSAIAWYVNGKIFRKNTFGLFQIVIMDLLTPLLRRLDPILPWRSLSYIAIMKKP
ncbi:MAG: glycosyltransferase [Thermodesulfobacteriota bacterium]